MTEASEGAGAVIDGAAVARALVAGIAERVRALPAGSGKPGLTVILVGDDPASGVYVRNKVARCEEAGFRSEKILLPASVSEAELLERIEVLNRDPAVHGILVQLPLPPQIRTQAVIEALAPEKDVDGFCRVNVGALGVGAPQMVPCTPKGSLKLLQSVLPSLAGLHAVVVGRSTIVGRPMAQLLLNQDCTVTIAHSRTRDLPGLTRQADIVVAAVGRPKMLGRQHIREGAVVIDVGINRIEVEGKARLVGDVDYEAVRPLTRAITPVPGGVGPMTIACLLENTLEAFEASRKALAA